MRPSQESRGRSDSPASHWIRSWMIFVAFLGRIKRSAGRLAKSRCRFCGSIFGERLGLMLGLSHVVYLVPLADVRLRS